MKQSLRRVIQGTAAIALAALTLSLTGCTNFFICDKSSCSGGTGGNTAAGNVAYVSNSASGSTYINGYTLSSGTPVASTNSPYQLNYSPTAMVVTPNNSFLYVGSNTGVAAGTGVQAIYGYSIGTGGALSIVTTQALISAVQVAAMDVSPDGQWLLVLTTNDGITVPAVVEYQIGSTGTLSLKGSVTYSGSTSGITTPLVLKVAPTGDYIAAALGTGGVVVFPFTTSSGTIGTNPTLIQFQSGSAGAYDIAIDSNDNLFMNATGGNVQSFTVTSAVPSSTISSLTTISGGPFSILVDGTSYVYSGATDADTKAGSVFGFTNGGSAKLTAFTSGATAGPTSLTKLALDSTAKYVLAAGYDSSSGLQMYNVGSGGALTLAGSMPTGSSTNVPVVMALTH